MICPEDAAKFVADWWELSGNIATTVSAFRHLQQLYPGEYLVRLCHPDEIAHRAEALQEICRYFEALSQSLPRAVFDRPAPVRNRE